MLRTRVSAVALALSFSMILISAPSRAATVTPISGSIQAYVLVDLNEPSGGSNGPAEKNESFVFDLSPSSPTPPKSSYSGAAEVPGGKAAAQFGFTPQGLNVQGSADARNTVAETASDAEVTGTLRFSLPNAGRFNYRFSGISTGASSVDLFAGTANATATPLLSCQTNPNGTGCGQPSEGSIIGQPLIGDIQLAAGNYQGNFAANTLIFAGVVEPAQFSFSLSAVPVPASVWLFASALLALPAIARRRHDD